VNVTTNQHKTGPDARSQVKMLRGRDGEECEGRQTEKGAGIAVPREQTGEVTATVCGNLVGPWWVCRRCKSCTEGGTASEGWQRSKFAGLGEDYEATKGNVRGIKIGGNRQGGKLEQKLGPRNPRKSVREPCSKPSGGEEVCGSGHNQNHKIPRALRGKDIAIC